ncbi:hypothetical protein [Streptomyces virginiae]|uniref:hypothetical protein n=1 Tax=Streptomyces virginiae TaxID=1961 RepID=UPI002DC030A8|nr:hypothetical protein [Streptomyces sp. CMAA1738]MEC4571072.1 hypothetical protein [Streptomyces sp. CMAA1738]
MAQLLRSIHGRLWWALGAWYPVLLLQGFDASAALALSEGARSGQVGHPEGRSLSICRLGAGFEMHAGKPLQGGRGSQTGSCVRARAAIGLGRGGWVNFEHATPAGSTGADEGLLQDEGLIRRAKALACTAPLHDLDANKGMLEWADVKVYQMAEIALHTIDQVAIAMDFDTGASRGHVLGRVKRFVARQAPERSDEEHAQVAGWVLDSLINVGDVERAFRRSYGTVDADGVYRVRWFPFKLLVERRDSAGVLYLHASHEALNVLVGALDTDVESAQEATEVKLANLIRRGRLTDAKQVAEQARIRSIQYGELIHAQLEATRRNILSVDWMEEFPALLGEALEHVQGRVRAERTIATNMAKARDEAVNPVRKRHAAELIDIVEDCIRRHIRLQQRLLEARGVFRAEQDRQQFSLKPQRATFDLFGQLLRPSLELAVTDAVRAVDCFFSRSTGSSAQDLPFLATLVPALLRPAPEPSRFAGHVEEPEVELLEEATRFTAEQWEMAERLLHLPGEVRALSSLLEEAAGLDADLPALVALLGVHSFSPDAGAAQRRGESHVRLAMRADATLDSAGFAGDDLWLTTARLQAPSDSSDRAGRSQDEGAGH